MHDAGHFVLVLLVWLSLNPEVHPALGEMVVCASISLDLNALSYIHISAVSPTTLATALQLWGFQ